MAAADADSADWSANPSERGLGRLRAGALAEAGEVRVGLKGQQKARAPTPPIGACDGLFDVGLMHSLHYRCSHGRKERGEGGLHHLQPTERYKTVTRFYRH